MIQLNIKSSHKKSIALYKLFLAKILKEIQIEYKVVDVPTKRRRITLLKSPHVNKAAREQFEFRNYKTVFFVKNKASINCFKFLFTNKPKTVKLTLKRL